MARTNKQNIKNDILFYTLVIVFLLSAFLSGTEYIL